MKGKPWTHDEEKKLRELLRQGKDLETIAPLLKRTPDALKQKVTRLGIEVVVQKNFHTTTSSVENGSKLLTIQEALEKLSTAIKKLESEGLEKKDIIRLRTLIQGIKIYSTAFADYTDYHRVEAEVLELREMVGQLVKKAEENASRAAR